MFGAKARRISNLESDVVALRESRDAAWDENGVAYKRRSEVLKLLDEANKRLVTEIEARIASEDATNILASVLCDLVRKKRSKKKG